MYILREKLMLSVVGFFFTIVVHDGAEIGDVNTCVGRTAFN